MADERMSEKMSEKRLNNCPFCGKKLVVANDGMAIHPMGDCFLGSTAFRMTDIWVRRWNTRVPMQKIVERLEKLNKYEETGDCPKDGMCSSRRCNGCYSNSAIEIVKEEGGLCD